MALDERLRELAGRVPPPPPSDGTGLFRRGVRRRRIRQGAVTVVVLAVAGVGVLSLIEPPASPEIADVPTPSPTATETDIDTDAGEPGSISCEPAGCEVWRRPLDGANEVPFFVDGPPVVIEAGNLVGLDMQSGDERWSLPVDDVLRQRPDGPLDQSYGQIALAGTDDHVAVATSRGVQLVSQDGQARWTQPLAAPEAAVLQWLHVTDDAVIVVHEAMGGFDSDPGSDAGEGMPVLAVTTVLAASSGEVRWSGDDHRQVFALPALADQEGLLLARSGDDQTMTALELATGATRYELPAGDDRWPVHTGSVLTFGEAPEEATASQLYDVSTGSDRASLEGAARAVLDMDGRTIVLLAPEGDGSDAREVVAVDPDGSVAWRQPLEAAAPDRCCATILDLGDGAVRVADGPGVRGLVVDVTDGTQRDGDPLADMTAQLDTVQPLGRHLLAAPATPDDPAIGLFDASGRSLWLRGEFSFAPYLGDTPPETMLLANPRELVAVRFP